MTTAPPRPRLAASASIPDNVRAGATFGDLRALAAPGADVTAAARIEAALSAAHGAVYQLETASAARGAERLRLIRDARGSLRTASGRAQSAAILATTEGPT